MVDGFDFFLTSAMKCACWRTPGCVSCFETMMLVTTRGTAKQVPHGGNYEKNYGKNYLFGKNYESQQTVITHNKRTE